MKPLKKVVLGDKIAERDLNDSLTDLYNRVGKITSPSLPPSQKVEKLPSSLRSEYTGLINRQEVEPAPIVTPDEYSPSVSENVVTNFPVTSPAPKIGDAVHFEVTNGLCYRADPLVRRNVIGVMSGDGTIAMLGIAKNIPSLTANYPYYLKWPDATIGGYYSYDTSDTNYSIRYNATYFARSQSFLGVAGKAIHSIAVILAKVGAPTVPNVYIEIRNDDGTGKPGNTVLAVSETINIDDIGAWTSDQMNFCQFVFYNSFIMSATTYHFCITIDTRTTSTTDYIVVRGVAAGAYANGQMCYQGTNGVWTAVAAVDLCFYLLVLDLTSTATPNITTVHPFDQGTAVYDQASHIFMPIIQVGRGVSSTELLVDIEKRQTICFLNDRTTAISQAGVTPTYNKIAEVTTYGVEKIAILAKLRSSDSDYFAYLTFVWGGAKGTTLFTTQRFFPWVTSRAHIFNVPVNGLYTLGAEIYSEDAGATGYAKYFTVIGG